MVQFLKELDSRYKQIRISEIEEAIIYKVKIEAIFYEEYLSKYSWISERGYKASKRKRIVVIFHRKYSKKKERLHQRSSSHFQSSFCTVKTPVPDLLVWELSTFPNLINFNGMHVYLFIYIVSLILIFSKCT